MSTRAESIAAVREQFGLTDVLPSDWSYDQRTQYNKALAAYILANERDAFKFCAAILFGVTVVSIIHQLSR